VLSIAWQAIQLLKQEPTVACDSLAAAAVGSLAGSLFGSPGFRRLRYLNRSPEGHLRAGPW
jgi:signal recognition particle receptor subunit beta